MKNKKCNYLSAFLKWAALLAVVFALSVPWMSRNCQASANTYMVSVPSGYLALRTQMLYDSRNEIGQLYSGDTVEVNDYSDSTYWYAYSPKYDSYGYVNKNYLISMNSAAWTVSVSKGYLALRNAKAYDASNEIGQLYNGDTVQVNDTSDPTYWLVYSPKYNCTGYVNKDYLVSSSTVYACESRAVKVDKGYLALRNAKAYDSSNEIGQLYTGDTVQLLDTSDPTYWLVYSPKYNLNGFVNKDYLVGGSRYTGAVASSDFTRTVSVSKGYLALRNAKAYDASNEIGQLNTGDTVSILDTSDPTYWFVYSPRLNMNGYVNKDYLVGSTAPVYPTWTVSVAKGYLALRNAKAYDSSNEIGKLNNGETVQVIDSSDPSYWYVYSSSLMKYGYVNKDYLY